MLPEISKESEIHRRYLEIKVSKILICEYQKSILTPEGYDMTTTPFYMLHSLNAILMRKQNFFSIGTNVTSELYDGTRQGSGCKAIGLRKTPLQHPPGFCSLQL